MLTPITQSDLLQVFGICDRANEQMDFAAMGYPYSHEAMARNWPKVIADPNHVSFCYKTEGVVQGIFLARLQDSSYFMQNYLVAYEIAFHADPLLDKVRRARVTLALRRGAEEKLRERGVKTFFLSTHPQVEGGMESNLDKNGYRCIGRYRAKAL